MATYGWDDELLYGRGDTETDLGVEDLRAAVKEALDKLGKRERVLIVPPVRPRRPPLPHAAFLGPAMRRILPRGLHRLRGGGLTHELMDVLKHRVLCVVCGARTSRGRTPRPASSQSLSTTTTARRSKTSCPPSALM